MLFSASILQMFQINFVPDFMIPNQMCKLPHQKFRYVVNHVIRHNSFVAMVSSRFHVFDYEMDKSILQLAFRNIAKR